MLSCSYNRLFGIECPGCGFQRSLVLLLKGEFVESVKTFPALIPILLMFLFLMVHLIVKLKIGARILLTMFIANIAIMLINFIYKLII